MTTKMKSSLSLKDKNVNNLSESIKKSKTLMVVSIKNLPSKQFQSIKKSMRKDADIKVAKRNIVLRALEKAGISNLNNYIISDSAFVISKLEAYELAGKLSEKKTPVFARAGQIAPEDIEVKEGPTNLVPGPAISELGALGIQISVENGKISIKKNKIIINKGQTIKENVASVLQKLNIMPFSVGLDVKAAYDIDDNKLYTELKIDSEGYTKELKHTASKSLGFAQIISYVCKETITFLLFKANSESKVLEKNIQLNKSEENA